jgi:hypothetical protein
MKQWAIHIFYLTIIAFLSYNYWSSVQAFKAFEQLNEQLNMDYSALDYSSEIAYRKIYKNCMAYRSFMERYYNQTTWVKKNADSSASFFKVNKAEFIKINGGFDTSNHLRLVKNISSASFLTDAKINEIRNKLTEFSNILIDSISDKKDKESLIKQYDLPQLIADNAYWKSIKNLPANAALAELSLIENKIKTDEIVFLNYQLDRTSDDGWHFDSFKTQIAPKKAVLIEGEIFEADVYVASYSNNLGSNVIIKVNGEPLEIHEGVAHFKSKNQTIGTKTIKAEAIIRNPLTGLTKTTEGSFEYQVLPKCSANCQ